MIVRFLFFITFSYFTFGKNDKLTFTIIKIISFSSFRKTNSFKYIILLMKANQMNLIRYLLVSTRMINYIIIVSNYYISVILFPFPELVRYSVIFTQHITKNVQIIFTMPFYIKFHK